jgi:hypothetical protein
MSVDEKKHVSNICTAGPQTSFSVQMWLLGLSGLGIILPTFSTPPEGFVGCHLCLMGEMGVRPQPESSPRNLPTCSAFQRTLQCGQNSDHMGFTWLLNSLSLLLGES